MSLNGLLILSGTHPVLNERLSQSYTWALNMRRKLVEKGSFAIGSDSLVFVRDVELTGPSAATAAVHGGHVNGLTAWNASESVPSSRLKPSSIQMQNVGVKCASAASSLLPASNLDRLEKLLRALTE